MGPRVYSPGVSVPWFFARAPAPGALFGEVLPWLGALVGVVVVGTVAIWLIRRTFGRDDRGGPGGFTLQDLRTMHAAGRLSDEEFRQAKESVIGRSREPQSDAADDGDGGDDGDTP